jgi:hypothetical protein
MPARVAASVLEVHVAALTCASRAADRTRRVHVMLEWTRCLRVLICAVAPVALAACSDGDDAQRLGPPSGEWLKGDLHLHSAHSNDALDNPQAEVIAKAESLGMDYFVFTDHDNHVQGNITTWDDPAYRSDSMVMLYGVEWTTARAHVNLFGTEPWDHQRMYALRDGDAAAAIDEAHALGLHFSVNHPASGDPWEHPLDLDFDSIEVWNAVYVAPASNSAAIALWDGILASGRRLTARGGSDVHHQTGIEAQILNVGNPTTFIYARERTPEAILEALKAGRVSISYAPSAERIDFTADADGDGVFESLIGDNLDTGGQPIRLKVEIVGFRPGTSYEVRLLKNGEAFQTAEVDSSLVSFEDTPSSDRPTYYRVELHGPVPDAPPAFATLYGDVIAMSNPIYVSFP